MENNREIFIAKLDRFIRKYYQNLILRGILYSFILIISYAFLLVFSEYYLYLPVTLKTLLVIFSGILLIFLIFKNIISPAISLLKLRQRISYRQAIEIISKHFPDLEDKLLNTFELSEQAIKNTDIQNSLLLASINQRIESIRLIPFRTAISFKSNFIYLKYLLAIGVVLILMHFLIPDMYSKSTYRLVNFDKKYEAPADFIFVLDNWQGRALKGSDLTLNLETKGKFIPDEVDLLIGDSKYLMRKVKPGQFSFLIRNINTDLSFKFKSGKIQSQEYNLELITKPGIKNFSISIQPPNYTKLPLQNENSTGDISIPDGSDVIWVIESENSSYGELIFSDSIHPSPSILEGNRFKFSRIVRENCDYRVYLTNNNFDRDLYSKYHINVIPDFYPQIKITSIQDSIIQSGYYFRGQIKDDYGFSKLRFVYEEENKIPVYIPIPFNLDLSSQEFFFAFDFSNENFAEGSNVKYYFEVFDNDEVNGSKKVSSQEFNYYIADFNQVFDLNTKVQDSISNKINQGVQLSELIQNDINRLQKNALDGSVEQWQQEQLLNEIGSKRRQLDQLLNQIKKENQRKNQIMNSTGLDDPLLIEKQKQIDDLLEKVMDSELQKLFDEFTKLANDYKTENLNKLGNQLKMSVNDFQKQLDRNLQLLERYEIEVRTKQLADRINQLANDQEKAANNPDKDLDLLKNQHQKGKDKWEEIKHDLQGVFEKNLSIQKPYNFDQGIKSKQNEIDELINNTNEFLNNGKFNKSANDIYKTSDKQRTLAKKLTDNLANSSSVQMTTDISSLIRLLSNLIEFSFQQEELLNEFKKVTYINPKYPSLIENQGNLREKYNLIQDSLSTLSERSPQVASLIGHKLFNIENQLELVLTEAGERKIIQTATAQQKVLTDVNELSIFLSEAIKSLMDQLANASPGDQLGDQKGAQSSLSGLKSQQNSLKKMLEDLISEMQNGNHKNSSNEKLGKFLQQQEMYRQNLNEILQKGSLTNESEKILREVSKMLDQMESDISNFSITSTMRNRQNQIFSKLLEAENAQREKDFDKKRESKSGNILKLSNPREIFEYKRVRTDFEGVFYDSNVKMFDYYNKLYLDYMIKLNND